MTLSRNPELWQALPAEKQNELENSPEFIAIEEEWEALSLEPTDNSIARDRRKELRARGESLYLRSSGSSKNFSPENLPLRQTTATSKATTALDSPVSVV